MHREYRLRDGPWPGRGLYYRARQCYTNSVTPAKTLISKETNQLDQAPHGAQLRNDVNCTGMPTGCTLSLYQF